jgi:hypothetical protein
MGSVELLRGGPGAGGVTALGERTLAKVSRAVTVAPRVALQILVGVLAVAGRGRAGSFTTSTAS